MSHSVEIFLRSVREVRDAGGVAETSFYPAVATLLNEAGARLQPRVGRIIHPQNRGVGIPDGGLFTTDQIGGIKKWLSCREQPLLGSPLKLEEVREVSHIARRVVAILLMEPALNDAHAATKAKVWPWNEGTERNGGG